jgi:hypothetical protein
MRLAGAALPSCADAPERNCQIDSKCDVPMRLQTKNGAILLMLEMRRNATPKGPSCGQDCMETLGLKASFNLLPCASCTRNCSLSLTWGELRQFEDKGQAYMGGLGMRRVQKAGVKYDVWSCVRDWDEEEQLACGARRNELACFWFEENSQQFHFKGLNQKTKLVSREQYARGMEMEARSLQGRTLSTSKEQAHV